MTFKFFFSYACSLHRKTSCLFPQLTWPNPPVREAGARPRHRTGLASHFPRVAGYASMSLLRPRPGRRDNAELLHQVQPIPLLELLRHLPPGQTADADAGEAEALAGARDAQQLSLVRPLGRPARRDLVPFREHVLDGAVQIGDGGDVHRPLLLGTLQPRRLPGQGTMVHVVLRDELTGPVHPLLVDDLLKPAPNDRLVLFGGHGAPPSLRRRAYL